ncbi:hypothetical protein AVEN_947-1 [Araneus ventricosus]|uniref:Uncharacterized protein n=1 Tax=Araneus ventricosus TaxID=182803 RepID=A0A4Y2CXC2_ARAVE|nr:hypothetical protein AVEN_947-1 [Araneus ventricosus]
MNTHRGGPCLEHVQSDFEGQTSFCCYCAASLTNSRFRRQGIAGSKLDFMVDPFSYFEAAVAESLLRDRLVVGLRRDSRKICCLYGACSKLSEECFGVGPRQFEPQPDEENDTRLCTPYKNFHTSPKWEVFDPRRTKRAPGPCTGIRFRTLDSSAPKSRLCQKITATP